MAGSGGYLDVVSETLRKKTIRKTKVRINKMPKKVPVKAVSKKKSLGSTKRKVATSLAIKKSPAAKKPAAAKKPQLINCGGSFELSIYGMGGEIVIGEITKKQYNYWNSRSSDELNEHLGIDGEEGSTPDECSLREWSDQDGIAPCNGPEFDTGECRISVTNADGKDIWKAKCDSQALKENGIEVEVENSMEIYKLKPGYYFCGKAFEKGSFFGATHESDTFDPTKLKFVVRNVNGWILMVEAYYDGEQLDGSDNYSTRTNSSEFSLKNQKK